MLSFFYFVCSYFAILYRLSIIPLNSLCGLTGFDCSALKVDVIISRPLIFIVALLFLTEATGAINCKAVAR